MIGRRDPRTDDEQPEELKSFDDFEIRLGDVMRGERATLGKSLLDVQRELRIKATYIAAIENCDPSAFDTPGFIAGYVRSYARYLGMDPDECFATFCDESGFEVAHGMSAQASVVRKQPVSERMPRKVGVSDPFLSPNMPFAPSGTSFWSEIEPRAIGSTLVLLALIGGIGYGGWSVLKQIQQVEFAPVEQTPVVLSDLDPLAGAAAPEAGESPAPGGLAAPSAEALDRLYRPQALDLPVLVARDAPISTLDPNAVGTLKPSDLPAVQSADDSPRRGQSTFIDGLVAEVQGPPVPQVVEAQGPALTMVAVRPSWVRVRSADGTTLYEQIMEPGDAWDVPLTEEPPTLRAGESGAVYFVVNGEHFGPVGPSGTVTSNVAMSIDAVTDRFAVADMEQDGDLARIVAEAQTGAPITGDE